MFGHIPLCYPVGHSLSVGVERCTVAATKAFHRAGLPQPLMEELMEPPEGSPAFSAQRSIM